MFSVFHVHIQHHKLLPDHYFDGIVILHLIHVSIMLQYCPVSVRYNASKGATISLLGGGWQTFFQQIILFG